jgi:AraC family transcriptional regulator of adaptative response / DNA-3-methyladenine glycosylase II
MTSAEYSRARLSRDARFDGLFFVAVKTTGIFCRPICPVVPPLEVNVEYFDFAAKAFLAGYRPCLRCRPDSAPGSCAWRGADTTFTRALSLIDTGALRHSGIPELAARLGISDRYLRRLFQNHLGLSPKAYALFGQIMFAKKLLHETSMSVSAIADAVGFGSQRRFNDAFLKHLKLAPSAIRRRAEVTPTINLTLAYRPPLDWAAMLEFWRKRCVTGVEWVDGKHYGRTFTLCDANTGVQAKGSFDIAPITDSNALQLRVQIDNANLLNPFVTRVRQILDLDADINLIERQLGELPGFQRIIKTGFRIPGIWHPFEAGVRAILGQQVSVAAARTHLERLVHALGEVDDDESLLNESALALHNSANQNEKNPNDEIQSESNTRYYFPTPKAIATSDLAMLKMPASRRDTLRRFAEWYQQYGEIEPVTRWLDLKGIGPWTVDYVQMRAFGHTDIWLAGDLGIKKALVNLNQDVVFDNEQLKPWRSYATFHLWNYLG